MIGVLVVSYLIGQTSLQSALSGIGEDLLNPVYGFLHFILTPVPFGTDVEYGFLDIPALIHWILLPVATYGLLLLLREKSSFAWFLLCYMLVFFGLYSVYAELHGPRHRVQLDYAWALLQFFGIRKFMGAVRLRVSTGMWNGGALSAWR